MSIDKCRFVMIFTNEEYENKEKQNMKTLKRIRCKIFRNYINAFTFFFEFELPQSDTSSTLSRSGFM